MRTRAGLAYGRLARRLVGCAIVAALLVLAVPTSAVAVPAYLLIRTNATPTGALVPFDTDNPGAANLNAGITITGAGGERILGIDFRPANGVLYGISEASRLYAINPATGSATQVGAPGATTLDPFTGVFQGVGFDFDPMTDLLRVTEDDGTVNGQDDNFSVNPVTGVFTQQGDLGGAPTDVDISGVAYTNAVAGATQTTLYGIETNQSVNDKLVVIDPPAAGSLTTIDGNGDGLGVVISNQEMGFDIISDPNRAFATFQTGGPYTLYRIDLGVAAGGNGTGDAASVAVLGSGAAQAAIPGFTVRGLALAPQDRDFDGVLDGPDNCPTTANGDQANLDGDAQGDACDDDDDGDGVPDAVEAGLGTNPRSADTDGDGKPDASDQCPTVAAATASGCPGPVQFTIGGFPSKIALAKLRKSGVSLTVAPNVAASFLAELRGRAKGAGLARAGDIVLAEKRLPLAAGKRTIRLKVAKAQRKRLRRKKRLELRVTATDAGGRTTVLTRRLTIR